MNNPVLDPTGDSSPLQENDSSPTNITKTLSDVDYVPAFLSRREADDLLAFLLSQHFVKNRLSYGPQIFPIAKTNGQASYVWATNIQSEPEFITALRQRMSDFYGVPFNSVQCNLHTGSHPVSAHADTYGVTAMLRVGCTRIFEVGGLPYRGTVFTSYPMPHGSLVTMKRSLQHKAEPQSDKGECVSIIFRFVTDGQTTSQWYDADKKIEGKMRRQHKKTYDRAVQDYKKGRAYAAAAQ